MGVNSELYICSHTPLAWQTFSLAAQGDVIYVAVTHTPLSKLVGWQMKWKLSSEAFLSSSLASLCDSHHSLVQVPPHLQRPQAGVPGEA